jgi:spore coat protein CotH
VQLYDNNKLATIRITFAAADTGTYTPAQWLDLLWSKWNHCAPFEKSDFVRVTFQYESPDGVGNATLTDVGIRIRGTMRRDYNQLAGFKLDFERWRSTATGAARRRFGDVNRLNTLSIEADPSHMIQCLAYKMMRDFGQPAPYCNHLKVYVNGTYYGLMESVEEPDNGRFMDHHFGSNAGEVYEASPSQGDCSGANQFKDSQAKLLYSGDSFSSYTSQYLISRGTVADAEAHLIPMLKCGDATQTASDATFKTCIAEWLDVPEWLREIAAEALMPTVESFFVQRNYILYFVPDAAAPHGGRFKIASWDLDNSFQRATCYPSSCDPFTSTASYYGPGGTRTKLSNRLTTVFKTEYCQAMRDFLNNVYKPAAVDAMSTVIEPGMQSEPVTPLATWQQNVMTMRSYITSHQASALTQVNTACN